MTDAPDSTCIMGVLGALHGVLVSIPSVRPDRPDQGGTGESGGWRAGLQWIENVHRSLGDVRSRPRSPLEIQANSLRTRMPCRLSAFILLILGLLLAACGGDDPTATPTSTAISEPTSESDSLATSDPTPESPSGEVTIGGDIGSQAPEFQGISNWINSEPLSIEDLRGKVVLVDFWTYTCVNCIRTLPYIKDWQDKYASHGPGYRGGSTALNSSSRRSKRT